MTLCGDEAPLEMIDALAFVASHRLPDGMCESDKTTIGWLNRATEHLHDLKKYLRCCGKR
jgi:hypothetical protein